MIVAAAGDAGVAAGFGLIMLLYGAVFLIAFGGIGLGIWALVDATSKPDWAWARTGDNRNTYILLIALGLVMCQIISLVASIVYLTSVRKRLQAAVQQGPPAYPYGPYGYGYGAGAPAAGYGGGYPPYGAGGFPPPGQAPAPSVPPVPADGPPDAPPPSFPGAP